jgi:hypothetical protein
LFMGLQMLLSMYFLQSQALRLIEAAGLKSLREKSAVG